MRPQVAFLTRGLVRPARRSFRFLARIAVWPIARSLFLNPFLSRKRSWVRILSGLLAVFARGLSPTAYGDPVRLLAFTLALSLGACAATVVPQSPIPSPSRSPETASARVLGPHVVSTIATEDAITILYSTPMKHGLACGSHGFAAGPVGTIDAYESNVTSRYYTSTDPEFDLMWSIPIEASLNADCTAVTFTFYHGVSVGPHPLQIVRVEDQSGRRLDPDPTIISVQVTDAGPPRMKLVQALGNVVSIQVSEPIRTALATDPTRYLLDGQPLPAGSSATCNLASCAVLTLTLPTAFRRIPERLTVRGLLDLQGDGFFNDTADITLGAGQGR